MFPFTRVPFWVPIFDPQPDAFINLVPLSTVVIGVHLAPNSKPHPKKKEAPLRSQKSKKRKLYIIIYIYICVCLFRRLFDAGGVFFFSPRKLHRDQPRTGAAKAAAAASGGFGVQTLVATAWALAASEATGGVDPFD